MVWSMVGRRRSTRVALLRLQLYHDDDCGGCEPRKVPRSSRVRTMTMVTSHHRYGNGDLLMYLWMKMLVARSELVGTVPVPARPLPQPRRLQYCGGGGGGGCRRCWWWCSSVRHRHRGGDVVVRRIVTQRVLRVVTLTLLPPHRTRTMKCGAFWSWNWGFTKTIA